MWVARDYNGSLRLHFDKPKRQGHVWHTDNYFGSPIIYIPKKEMGTAIKHLKSKFPTADGKMISEIVKKYLV